jgi:hypothetical protein
MPFVATRTIRPFKTPALPKPIASSFLGLRARFSMNMSPAFVAHPNVVTFYNAGHSIGGIQLAQKEIVAVVSAWNLGWCEARSPARDSISSGQEVWLRLWLYTPKHRQHFKHLRIVLCARKTCIS